MKSGMIEFRVLCLPCGVVTAKTIVGSEAARVIAYRHKMWGATQNEHHVSGSVMFFRDGDMQTLASLIATWNRHDFKISHPGLPDFPKCPESPPHAVLQLLIVNPYQFAIDKPELPTNWLI